MSPTRPTPRTPTNRATARAPTTPEIRERVINAARAVLPRKKVDKTYKYEIKNYKAWVEKQNVVKNGKYLTRENVDWYFADVQLKRNVEVNTARRVVSALQHLANEEYAGEKDGFCVESNTVLQMLAAQKQQKVEHAKKVGTCHQTKAATKNMTEIEKSKIVRYVLKENKTYWSDFLTTWNACIAMFCRVDTMQKIKINDIMIDTSHSVGSIKRDSENPFDQEMISMILRPYVHKERSTKSRIVGAYRHKDPFMCFTGCVSMNMFVLLNTEIDNNTFNFYETNENITNNIRTERDRCKSENYVEPNWSQKCLIRKWNSPNAVAVSYKQVLKANEVHWAKVTHNRKAGIEAASAAGLDAQSIGTMSKHNSERGSSKLNTAYVTELFPPVMLWASGYDRTDIHSYNNPRTRLTMPDNNIEHILFPRLAEWREQQESDRGDNRECAEHFLSCVVPYIAKVIVQDGIHWIKNYPRNEASLLLLSMMPATYPDWALDARRKNRNQARDVENVKIDNLNATSQRAFNMMISVQEQNHQQALQYHQQQQRQQSQLLQQMIQQQQQQAQWMQQMLQQQQEHKLEQQQQFQQMQLQQQQILLKQQEHSQLLQRVLQQRITGIENNDNVAIENESNNDNVAIENENNNDTVMNDNDTADDTDVPIQIVAAPIYPPPPARIQNINEIIVPVVNMNDLLRHDPVVPFIPPALPKTLKLLVLEHYNFGLDAYVHADKRHWSKKIQMAYSKRKNLFNYILDKATRVHSNDNIKTKTEITAIKMDREERGVLSVYEFAKFLRPTGTRRRRQQQQQQPVQLQQQRIHDYMPPLDGYLPQHNAGLL